MENNRIHDVISDLLVINLQEIHYISVIRVRNVLKFGRYLLTCKKNITKIFTVVMATKLEIKRYYCKQRKFFCSEMLLFRNKLFSQNDAF